MDRKELKKIISELIQDGDIYFDVDPSNDANEKVSEFPDGSPMQSTDYIPVVRNVDNVLTNLKVLASGIVSNELGPFDAKVDGIGSNPNCYTTIKSAILAGANVINWSSNGEEDTSIINITRNIFIFLNGLSNHNLNLTGFNVSENCTLVIWSDAQLNKGNSFNGPTFLCSNNTNNFFQGNGKIIVNGVCFVKNSSGGLLDGTILAIINGCKSQALGVNNQFIKLQSFGSAIQNSTIYGQGQGSNPDNSLIIGNGCVGKNIKYYNSTASTGSHITVEEGGKLLGIQGLANSGGGGVPLIITNNGLLDGIYTSYPVSPIVINYGTVSNTLFATPTGFSPVTASIANMGNISKIVNVNFVNSLITIDEAAVDSTIFNSNMQGGSYTDNGTNTRGFGNTGSLPNTVVFLSVPDAAARLALTHHDVKNDQIVTQDSDKTAWIAGVVGTTVTWFPLSGGVPGVNISPYQAKIDGLGALPNFYVNLGTAYAAGKTYDDTIANITETANINMSSTDQIYLLVGQGFSWDLSTYTITASAGNDFGLELADGSSKFQYSTAGLPFSNFNNLSSLVITGNGGVIQNTSATANSYIYSLGVLLAYNLRFLLPNVDGGGFKTSGYSHLSDIKFTGGGSNCEKAIITDGGKLSNIVLTGNNWKPNGFINAIGDNPTIWDTLYYDVNLPMSFYLDGQAVNVIKNTALSSSFLTVVFASNSTLTNSYADAVVLTSGIKGCKVIGGTLTTLSLAVDNSTYVELIGVTLPNNFVLYGSGKLIGCTFGGGGSMAVGSSFTINGCTSANGTTFTIPSGATAIRAGNNSIIGNDYGGGSTSQSITEYDGEIDGVGVLADHYLTFNDANTAGKNKLLFTANTSLVNNVTLSSDTYLKFLDCSLDLNGYSIYTNGFIININGTSYSRCKISASSSNTSSPISDSSTKNPYILTDNIMIDFSNITSANCAIGQTNCLISTRTYFKSGAADKSCIELNPIEDETSPAFGVSRITNSVVEVSSESSTNAINVNSGIFSSNEIIVKSFSPTSNLINIGVGNIFDDIVLTAGDGGFSITTKSTISNIVNPGGLTINAKFETGVNNIAAINCDLNTDGNVDFNNVNKVGINNIQAGSFTNATGSDLYILNSDFSLGGNNSFSGSYSTISNTRFGSTFTNVGNQNRFTNCKFLTFANNGSTASLSTCYALNFSETGSDRLSSACTGAIPNSYALSVPSASVTFSISSGVVNVIASRNITSVLLTGTGEITFNIANGIFSNGNYIVTGMCSALPGVGIYAGESLFGGGSAKTATVCQIFTFLANNNYNPPLATFYFIKE